MARCPTDVLFLIPFHEYDARHVYSEEMISMFQKHCLISLI